MKSGLPPSQLQIEHRIFTIRGVQVMIDSDLASVYQVPTSRLNEQVKRNLERFPEDFMFQLSQEEWDGLTSQNETSRLRSQNATLKNSPSRSQTVTLKENRGKHRKYLPYAFTEQGVASLSGVLKSHAAANIHVSIMRAFVSMRKVLQENLLVYNRLDRIELKQIETDKKFEQIFKALESRDLIPNQGVFYDGQVFDAYELASKIIRSAKQRIVLIDNYIDETTLTHLAKKNSVVKVLLLSQNTSKQLLLDVQKADAQYGGFELKTFSLSHDRFLIIDDNEVYHLGASLKDLGKKWFAFSRLDAQSVESLMKQLT